MFINIYYSFINRAFGSDFQAPLIGRTSVPACHHNVRRGRLTYHRGWGGVAENLHTPLSPLFRGESKRLKFLIVKEPITDVIEIEAKKAGTINEKTFINGDLLAFV